MNRLGLRARLALAFVSVAVLAVVFAAALGNFGLGPRLDEAARQRLSRSAAHLADISETVYADSGGWSPSARHELTHLAAIDGLRVAIRLPDGKLIRIGPAPTGSVAHAPIGPAGGRIGTITVSAAGGSLLTPEERHLRHSLDELHLAAGAAAAFAALMVGLLLAETLSRPLRRIRAVADRLVQGELEARVELSGEPAVRSVGLALNRLAETLEHEETLRKASVADLAHELRTPVNGLLARIEAAQDDVLPLNENLSAMHAETVRLTRLLDDLARLTDAEQPGLLLDKQPVDLAQIAGGVGESFAPRFAEAEIDLSVAVRAAWVQGDAGRLEQIVSNLLSNALRYTEAGGGVTVSVEPSGRNVVLEVGDTGVGIAPSDIDKIFTRFWRRDSSRSPSTGGTGIGLAIVNELVRAHDGEIVVESAPGHGSTFRVVLPASRERPTPDSGPAPIRGGQRA